jgi:excinuclease ABC subunit C
MNLEQFHRRRSKLPDEPGVYFFLGKNKKLLYIGKATSLRDRVRSYFAKDLVDTRGPLLVEMLDKATSIDFRQTDSVLEALLLEASLIRTHRPYFNTDLKDDKSFNHVVITKEEYPRVLVIRGRELVQKASEKGRDEHDPNSLLRNFVAPEYSHIFGPFPHGMQLQQAMKLIRKIFPYRTKCTPCKEQRAKVRPLQTYQGRSLISCKPCFDASIGLCPGVCSGAVGKAEYKCTIRHIVLVKRRCSWPRWSAR